MTPPFFMTPDESIFTSQLEGITLQMPDLPRQMHCLSLIEACGTICLNGIVPRKREPFVSSEFFSLMFFQVHATPRSCSICAMPPLAMPSSGFLGSSSGVFEYFSFHRSTAWKFRPSSRPLLQRFIISSGNMIQARFRCMMRMYHLTSKWILGPSPSLSSWENWEQVGCRQVRPRGQTRGEMRSRMQCGSNTRPILRVAQLVVNSTFILLSLSIRIPLHHIASHRIDRYK